MAQIRAEAGEKNVLVGDADAVYGTGTAGETYRVAARTGLVTFQGGFLEGGDTIFLEGPAENWTVRSGGGGSYILFTSGALEVRIPVPDEGSPSAVVFTQDILFGEAATGDTRSLFYDDTGATVVLGKQSVGSTSLSVSPEVSNLAVVTMAEVEANYTASTAQNIDRALMALSSDTELPSATFPTIQIRGSITPGDVDFYTIDLAVGERLIIDVDGTVNFDGFIVLDRPDGYNEGLTDDAPLDPGSATTADPFLEYTAVVSGTYTFRLESLFAGGASNYRINVSVGAPTPSSHQENIQALLAGPYWQEAALTFGFPSTGEDYEAYLRDYWGPVTPLTAMQQSAARAIFDQASESVGLTFTEVVGAPGSADLRLAQSERPSGGLAYYPGSEAGGDSWYRTGDLTSPIVGNKDWATLLHEIGHSLGLRHGHEAPALHWTMNSLEFSVMTYRSHVGGPIGGLEDWGNPQTFMLYDIAALQHLYGANYFSNAGDTVYSWNPATGAFLIDGQVQWIPGANRVFQTLWDGGGYDTYDLSSYTDGVTIDLRPGEWSITSEVQRVNLGTAQDVHLARGNVANAFLFQGDERSMIENARGGAGDDIIIANHSVNQLQGGAGSDMFVWHDIASDPNREDIVIDFEVGSDMLDLSNVDAIAGTVANEWFLLLGSEEFSHAAGQLRWERSGADMVLCGDTDGDGAADFSIRLIGIQNMSGNSIIA